MARKMPFRKMRGFKIFGIIHLGLLLCVQCARITGQATTGKPLVENITSTIVNQISDETIGLIRTGDQVIAQQDQYKDVVLVIGNTGAGKTTLTKFITGKRLESYQQNRKILIRDLEGKISTGSTLVSKTIFPELFIDSETNTAFYDLPGFSDTRNASAELANSWFMKNVADHVNRVKILVIINYSSLQHGKDPVDFKTLLDHTTSFIRNPQKFEDAIVMVASKVPAGIPANVVIPSVVDFIKEQRPKLNQAFTDKDGKLSKVEHLVDAILKTDENGNFSRIGYFHQLRTEGILSEIPSLRDNRDKLKTLVHNNVKFIEKTEADFGISVSAGLQIYVRFIIDKLNAIFTESIQKIAETVHNYYDSKVENATLEPAHLGEVFKELQQLKLVTSLLGNATSRAEFINIVDGKLIGTLPERQYFNFTAGLMKQDRAITFYENVTKRTIRPRVLEWIQPIHKTLIQLQNNIQEAFVALNLKFDQILQEVTNNINMSYQAEYENAPQLPLKALQTLEQNLIKDIAAVQNLTDGLSEEMSFNALTHYIVNNSLGLKNNNFLELAKLTFDHDVELKALPELRPASWKGHFYILFLQLTTLSGNLNQTTAIKKKNLHIASISSNNSALQQATAKFVAAEKEKYSKLEQQFRDGNDAAADLDKELDSLDKNYTMWTSQYKEQIEKNNAETQKAEMEAQTVQDELDKYNNEINAWETNLNKTIIASKSRVDAQKRTISQLKIKLDKLKSSNPNTIVVFNYTQIPAIYDKDYNKCSSLCRNFGGTSYTWCYLEQPANSYWGYCSPPSKDYDFSKIKISTHGIPCQSTCTFGLVQNGYGCLIPPTRFFLYLAYQTDKCSPKEGENYKGEKCKEECNIDTRHGRQCLTYYNEYVYC